MPRAVAVVLVAVALLAVGCAASGPSSSVTVAPSASAEPPAESAAPSGIDLSSIPTACFGLGADDCRRVVAQLSTIVPTGSAVTYIQVGPFGCAAGQGCAPSLVERPQGDVTLEAGAGALSYHVTVAAGGAEISDRAPGRVRRPARPDFAAARHRGRAPVQPRSLRPVERHRCRRQLVGPRRPGRWRSPGCHQRRRRHAHRARPRPCHLHVARRTDRPVAAPRGRQVPAALPVGRPVRARTRSDGILQA